MENRDWVNIKLGDALTFQRGHDLSKSQMIDGIYQVAGSNGIIGCHNVYTTTGPGITIGRSGNIGTPHYYKGNFWAHNTVLYVKDFKGNNELFLYYFLKNIDFSSFNTGSAVPSLNRNHIHEYEIQLPPLPEQKAIASVLSSLDDKIDLLHQQNQTLEALAETLFRQWFIEEVKEDWEELRIVDLFGVKDGTHDSPKQKEFGKKLITSKHLFNFYIDLNSAYFISEEDYYNINKRSKVERGDILFSMIGTIGNIYLEDSENIDYAIKNIGLFKTSQNLNWKYFTYLWLKSNLGRDFIFENISGSTQEYISLGSLRSINFKVPNIETVILFNTKVKTLFDKLYINQQQIQTLTQLRNTLLPKLMSGEVRVKV